MSMIENVVETSILIENDYRTVAWFHLTRYDELDIRLHKNISARQWRWCCFDKLYFTRRVTLPPLSILSIQNV